MPRSGMTVVRSSTLHSNLVEMCRWMEVHLEPAEATAGGPDGQSARSDPGLLDLMRRPVVPVSHLRAHGSHSQIGQPLSEGS